MTIDKPQLFLNHKSFLWFILLVSLLILTRLSWHYNTYLEFISKPFYYTQAKVLNSYPKSKNGRSYMVVKLKSVDGLTFFTSCNGKEKLTGKTLRLQIFPTSRISFYEYLGYFYVKSRIKGSYIDPEGTFMGILSDNIKSQHNDKILNSFYSAIFFATPLLPKLRDSISMLGISHLVALSGFHLGILWILIYGTLSFIYKFFQQRYFPYRFTLLDIGFTTLVILGVYVWFTGYPASLLRSFIMLAMGWGILLLGIELVSFTFLSTISMLLLLVYPAFIVSLSFWLSVLGVFYIFLLLQYSKGVNAKIISIIIIPFGIFILMLPIVHSIFGMTTIYQLLSPFLSILFIPFYPIAMLLHLLELGGLLDGGLAYIFALKSITAEHLLPWYLTLAYFLLSLLSIWRRCCFVLLLFTSFGYALYLFA